MPSRLNCQRMSGALQPGDAVKDIVGAGSKIAERLAHAPPHLLGSADADDVFGPASLDPHRSEIEHPRHAAAEAGDAVRKGNVLEAELFDDHRCIKTEGERGEAVDIFKF